MNNYEKIKIYLAKNMTFLIYNNIYKYNIISSLVHKYNINNKL
jgi:hypothetical protein